jgi:hypothetical protein
VYFFTAWYAQLRHDPQATMAQATVVLTPAEEHAFLCLAALDVLLRGWAVVM